MFNNLVADDGAHLQINKEIGGRIHHGTVKHVCEGHVLNTAQSCECFPYDLRPKPNMNLFASFPIPVIRIFYACFSRDV